jgi:hypothetical protein
MYKRNVLKIVKCGLLNEIDIDCVLIESEFVWFARWVPPFQRKALLSSSGSKGFRPEDVENRFL